jgi:predicted DNA-binding transcriptional regulator AlpA
MTTSKHSGVKPYSRISAYRLAQLAGVNRSQITRWIKSGKTDKLPPFTVTNGRIRFLESDVHAWLKANNLPSLESFEKERAL